jgi:hypothetical protein
LLSSSKSYHMKQSVIFLIVVVLVSQNVSGFSAKRMLLFKTSKGHIIKVYKGIISLDNKRIYKMNDDEIIYDNVSNKTIEDHGSVLLFLVLDDRPNLEKLGTFMIKPGKAILVAKSIRSPIKDYDNDGFLEFGGSDLTEGYPNPDSMYYIPTSYYEIRNGKVHPDKSLTRNKDVEINGIYLPPKNQLDKDGFCCKVIPKPPKLLRK